MTDLFYAIKKKEEEFATLLEVLSNRPYDDVDEAWEIISDTIHHLCMAKYRLSDLYGDRE